MPVKSFSGRIRNNGPGTWNYVALPATLARAFGTRARIPVRGTVNGVPFRSSLLPDGEGGFFLVVKSSIRSAAMVREGDSIRAELTVDRAPRTIRVPTDLSRALSGRPELSRAFGHLAYSHQKRFADWIEGAKKTETRSRRIEATLSRLSMRPRKRSPSNRK